MDTKWTTPGKVLLLKSDIKKLGLNNVDTSAPSNPEEGEPWYESVYNFIKFHTGANWLSRALFSRVKRTTDETNGPFLDELIDSKNDITDNTATTFMNISIANVNCTGFILLEYLINSEDKTQSISGQFQIGINRESGSNTESRIIETIDSMKTPYNDSSFDLLSIADDDDGKIYRHSTFSTTIRSSFSSPSTATNAIYWDGTDLYSATGNNEIYQHSGFDAAISDSFIDCTGSGVRGMTFISGDLVHVGSAYDRLYRHSGFSHVIHDSFSTPSTSAWGVAWDGTYLYTADRDSNKIYRHSGFDARILESFSIAGKIAFINSLTWDNAGDNLITVDDDKIWRHSGFSIVIKESFDHSPTAIGLSIYYTDNIITYHDIALGSLTGGVTETQTLPVQITCRSEPSAVCHIRYNARILSGGFDDATSGCEITLAAA